MKVTEKQLLILLDTLKGSLHLADGGSLFGYDAETRRLIYNKIVNQSNDELIEVGTEPTPLEGSHV